MPRRPPRLNPLANLSNQPYGIHTWKSAMHSAFDAGANVNDGADLESKIFVLGVGAQRSGSSWLHAYLASHPVVGMSEIKELHYFDAVWRADHRRHAYSHFTSALQRLDSGIDRGGSQLSPERARQRMLALSDRLAMFDGGDRAYVEYFRRRVSPNHTHFGEITPAYSLLPAEG